MIPGWEDLTTQRAYVRVYDSMFPEVVEGEATWDFIHACCESKVPVVELSGRDTEALLEKMVK